MRAADTGLSRAKYFLRNKGMEFLESIKSVTLAAGTSGVQLGLDIFYQLCLCMGGIAMFMFAMKTLSEGLESLAGSRIKGWLNKATSNSLMGVGVGTGVTALVHSSTAITVMMVGFVNVGLMTLRQAAAVIMGANIGTTITLQIVSLKDYFNISAIMALGAMVGLLMTMLANSDKKKKAGILLIAVGMLFLGLDIMEDAMGGLSDLIPQIGNMFNYASDPFLMVIIGCLFTAIIQSSTASTIILIALVEKSTGGPEVILTAFYAILGMNIGTCLTAIISSIGANVAAKRTAFLHLFFNVAGCVVAFVPMYIWGDQIAWFFERISGEGAYGRQIANFHTIYNVLSTVALLPLIGWQVKLAEFCVREKPERPVPGRQLRFLDDRIMETPSVALSHMTQEIFAMGQTAMQNLEASIDSFIKGDTSRGDEIRDREQQVDYLNRAITEYLVKISSADITLSDEKRVSSFYHVITDLERVGDYAENVLRYAEKIENSEIVVSDEAMAEIGEMFKLVKTHFDYCMKAFSERNLGLLSTIDVLENKVDEAKAQLADSHIQRLSNGVCTAQAGAIYLSLVSNLERVADHMNNVAYSIKAYAKPQPAAAAKKAPLPAR